MQLDDPKTLLLAVSLGAVAGILCGSWVIMAVQKLMMGVVKMALLAAVVAIGVFLWSTFQDSRRPPDATGAPLYQPTSPSSQLAEPTYAQENTANQSGRWWEQKKSE